MRGGPTHTSQPPYLSLGDGAPESGVLLRGSDGVRVIDTHLSTCFVTSAVDLL